MLELVEAVADVLSSCHLGDLLPCSTAGLATEVLAESLDTNLLSHVELVADGGSAGVEPVRVEGVQLLVESSLDGDGPLLNIIIIKTPGNKLKIKQEADTQFWVFLLAHGPYGRLTSGILNLLICFRC